MKLSKMNLKVFLIISSFFCVQSAPAKPLNERSTELTWQAWLLVDDQNQNKQTDADGLIRRRITPKSVFIAPTFSPDSLPACADGYTSDPMGRCIKIIQLDADAQLNFILDRLKQQFGSFDEYDDDTEEMLPTPGPFQFNIPLGQTEEKIADTNIAIVVAPTNGNFDLTKNDSFVIKKKQNPPQSELDAPIIVTKINIKDDDEVIPNKFVGVTKKDETIVTATEKIDLNNEKSSTDAITEIFDLGTEKNIDIVINTELVTETTTDVTTLMDLTTSQDLTTTEQPETTTSMETTTLEQAIFFKIPNNITKANEAKPINTIEELIASENKPNENFVRFPDETIQTTDYIKYPKLTSQLLPQIDIKNRFRDTIETKTEPNIKQQLPDVDIKTKFETSLFDDLDINDRRIFNNRDTQSQHMHHNVPNRHITPDHKTQEHYSIPNHNSQHHSLPNTQELHQNDRLHSVHRVYNHRNRDKTWQFPPDWRESQPQKPLVLRFTNVPHRQANEFYQHHPRQDGVYREVPPDDLSYIFGFKKGITHR